MKRLCLIFITFILCTALFCVYVSAAVEKAPSVKDISFGISAAKTTPVLDGEISKNEYTKLGITSGMYSYAVASEEDWRRARLFVFDVYACYDSENLYIAVSYNMPSAYYITDAATKNMWAQSCVMVSLAPKSATKREALEMGIRITDSGILDSYIWNYNDNNSYTADGNFSASHSANHFTYEICVPFSSFGASASDGSFAMCVCVSGGDYYNSGRSVYVQTGRGIAGFSDTSDAESGKYVSLFPRAVILSADDSENEETLPYTEYETEAPVEPKPPITGEALPLIFIPVLCLAFTALICRAFKKRH